MYTVYVGRIGHLRKVALEFKEQLWAVGMKRLHPGRKITD